MEILERGACVGRYVIVEKIGMGGMGVVYRAFDPELSRLVALKMLSLPAEAVHTDPGKVSRNRARLLREAQALGQLSHPNVVTVHDVGTHENSVFIAMELVDGLTFSHWLAEKKPDLQEILSVMVAAGKGLLAAHQAGLIHRDFKPGNMIVGKDGRVRVLDFGLARLAGNQQERAGSETPDPDLVPPGSGEPSTESQPSRDGETNSVQLTSSLTKVGAVIGTPGYMSPEQLHSWGLDARSDQFSFCIVLFEALYGRLPFSGSSLSRIARNISERRIKWPSQASQIPVWLKEILLRGLQPSCDDRFANMADLLKVLATDPNAAAREARRRRRRLLWSTAVVVLFLGALSAGVWYGMTQGVRFCQGAEARLLGVWDAPARMRVKEAFMASGLAYAPDAYEQFAKLLDARAAKWVAMRTEACETTHVAGEQSEALLDLRIGCLNGKLQELRALAEVLSHQLDADLVTRAVSAAAGLSPLSVCADTIALSARIPPPDDPVARRQVEDIRSKLLTVRALQNVAKFKAAQELATQAVAEAQTVGYRPVSAEALFELGLIQGSLGLYQEAGASWRSAELNADAAGYTEVRAKSLAQLVRIVGARQAKYAAAAELTIRAQAVIDSLGGDEGAEIGGSLQRSLFAIYWTRRDLANALTHARSSLALHEKALGPEHPDVAASLNNLGILLAETGEYQQAKEYYQRSLAIYGKVLGAGHPTIAQILNNLSISLLGLGEPDLALQYRQQALKILENALGSNHPAVARALSNLGQSFALEARFDQALPYFQRAVKVMTAAQGDYRTERASILGNIGLTFSIQKNYARALPYLNESLTLYQDALGPDHTEATETLDQLGETYLALQQPAKAVAAFERALHNHIKAHSAPASIAIRRLHLAKALWQTKLDRSRARKLVKQAQDALSQAGPKYEKTLSDIETWLK